MTAGMIPVILSIIGLLGCAMVLLGWGLVDDRLTAFGSPYHMQPFTAVALALVAIGILAALRGYRREAALLAGIALVIALVALFENATGVALGVDALFFEDALANQMRFAPGRPGTMSAICIALLAFALLASSTKRRRRSQIVLMLASVALGIAAIAGAPLPLGLIDFEESSRHARMSMPTAGVVTLLSIAFIAWRQYFDRCSPETIRGIEGRTLRTIFVLCVLAPIALALLRLWALQYAAVAPQFAEIIEATAHIAISASVLLWAWSRIAREHVARRALLTALDSAPVALLNMAGDILHWSKGCEKLYGWSADEAIGHRKQALLGGDAPGRWQSILDSLSVDESCEAEVTEFRRDGSALKILEHATLIRARADSDPVVVLSMTDLSDRKRAEEELRASDARLALAVEAHGIGIFEWDAGTRTVNLSADAERLLRIENGDGNLGIKGWCARIQQNFVSEMTPSEDEMIAARLPRFGFRLQSRHDDPPRAIEGSSRCFYSSDGRLVRMIGVLFDTTERERRAAALAAHEAELRSILETVPDAMITTDERGRIRSFSAAAEALWGYRPDEVIGRDATMLMPRRLHAQHRALLTRYLTAGYPYLVGHRRSTTALHRDGTEIPIELAVGEAHSGSERIFIGFVRNLREQLEGQARLAELQHQLLHVSRLSAMGEIAAGLAHELNQPLAATANFLGAADLLLADADVQPERVRDLVKFASTQTLRAGDIIRRVRTFVAKGEVDIRVEPVGPIIADAVDLVLSGAHAQNTAINYDLDAACRLILADRVQIQQVLVNVIRNALEALRDHPGMQREILLATRGAPDDMVEFSVADNGPGIPDHILERRNEPFVSTKAHGMGVGLSICKRIIEWHGGTFSVANQPLQGAVIRFTLPAVSHAELLAG